MGEGRKKAKESRVVPHPKLNPGCATDSILYISTKLTSVMHCETEMNASHFGVKRSRSSSRSQTHGGKKYSFYPQD